MAKLLIEIDIHYPGDEPPNPREVEQYLKEVFALGQQAREKPFSFDITSIEF